MKHKTAKVAINGVQNENVKLSIFIETTAENKRSVQREGKCKTNQ